MKIEDDIKLDFDDVLIKPKRSEAASRKEVCITRFFKFKYSPYAINKCPIIAANMDTTGSISMAKSLNRQTCLTALHKFHDREILSLVQIEDHSWFYTLGIQDEDFEKLKNLGWKPMLICVDVANGYTQQFVKRCAEIREYSPFSIIMAGNVCTPEMVQELVINGRVDIVKIGIGPGSVCTTRLKTGCGYPQLSAIAECADVAHGLSAHICADGGIKNAGDVCKALGAGADFVMIGSLLSGTDECDGEWFYNDSCQERQLKYHGMSSKEAQTLHHGKMDDYKSAEGIEIIVPNKGPAINIIKDIQGGIRSCCAYIGAKSIKDLAKCCTFIKVNRIK
jgi:GMP reductase